MKTPYALLILAIGSALTLVYFGCASDHKGGKTSDKIVIEKNSIEIPGTDLSAADRQAMNNILKKYDRSLYRVDTYKNGVLKSTMGTLNDFVMGKKFASEMAAAGADGCVQFVTRGSVPHVAASPMDPKGSEELVNALKPILQKYSAP